MNNASKIDTNWTKIFNKYPILQTIKDEGKYIITAQQIKEFWEPRLMTKHDHSVNRPQIFIVSILFSALTRMFPKPTFVL
ncbi:MAG: type II restriction enzyme [Bacteroides xylanisolvens]